VASRNDRGVLRWLCVLTLLIIIVTNSSARVKEAQNDPVSIWRSIYCHPTFLCSSAHGS
jgi:hypothetical protein